MVATKVVGATAENNNFYCHIHYLLKPPLSPITEEKFKFHNSLISNLTTSTPNLKSKLRKKHSFV